MSDVTITLDRDVAEWAAFWLACLPMRWEESGVHPRDLIEDERRLEAALQAFEIAGIEAAGRPGGVAER